MNNLLRGIESRKFKAVVFTLVLIVGAYAAGVRLPEGVAMAAIGMVSAYVAGQSWVDSRGGEK